MPKQEIRVEFETPSDELLATASHLSGLEFLRAIINGDHPRPPMGELMEFRIVEADPGRAVFEGRPSDRVYNPIGMVHGGYAGVLIDSVTGCAVQTMLDPGVGYGNVDVNVHLTRRITRESGVLRAEGTLVHLGKRMATAEAKITDESGTVIAHGTSTCLITPAR